MNDFVNQLSRLIDRGVITALENRKTLRDWVAVIAELRSLISRLTAAIDDLEQWNQSQAGLLLRRLSPLDSDRDTVLVQSAIGNVFINWDDFDPDLYTLVGGNPALVPANAVTFNGDVVTFNGETVTYG
jgi:hypothetical protein